MMRLLLLLLGRTRLNRSEHSFTLLHRRQLNSVTSLQPTANLHQDVFSVQRFHLGFENSSCDRKSGDREHRGTTPSDGIMLTHLCADSSECRTYRCDFCTISTNLCTESGNLRSYTANAPISHSGRRAALCSHRALLTIAANRIPASYAPAPKIGPYHKGAVQYPGGLCFCNQEQGRVSWWRWIYVSGTTPCSHFLRYFSSLQATSTRFWPQVYYGFYCHEPIPIISITVAGERVQEPFSQRRPEVGRQS